MQGERAQKARSVTVYLRMARDLRDSLQALADKDHRSLSGEISWILAGYMAKEEQTTNPHG